MSAPQRDGSGWLGSELTDTSRWVTELDGPTVDRLIRHVHDGHHHSRLARITEVADIVDRIRHDLLAGPGFSLLRGLPVDELDDDENAALCTTIGNLLGIPIRQNAAGDELIRVRDEGKDFSQKGVRSYETKAPLPYHSDSSDVVGLYCRRPARSGGASTIISSVAVHDAMVDARPDDRLVLFVSPEFGWGQPHHLELDAIGGSTA